MVEGLSLAGMTETPIVIALGQRPGPATGFPTRTEQGELQFLISAGHGEFPRVILAPGTPSQAFFLTNKAFDLAEKYQVPVFILFDTYLSDSQWTLDGLDLSKVRRCRLPAAGRSVQSAGRLQAIRLYGERRLPPGRARRCCSRCRHRQRRTRRGGAYRRGCARPGSRWSRSGCSKNCPGSKQEIAAALPVRRPRPGNVLVGWGSIYGVMREAVDELSKSASIAMLHFSEVFPLPGLDRFDYMRLLGSAKRTICIEQNATGQFDRLIKAETGFEFSDHIRKYDGRPFLREELAREVKEKCDRISRGEKEDRESKIGAVLSPSLGDRCDLRG